MKFIYHLTVNPSFWVWCISVPCPHRHRYRHSIKWCSSVRSARQRHNRTDSPERIDCDGFHRGGWIRCYIISVSYFTSVKKRGGNKSIRINKKWTSSNVSFTKVPLDIFLVFHALFTFQKYFCFCFQFFNFHFRYLLFLCFFVCFFFSIMFLFYLSYKSHFER